MTTGRAIILACLAMAVPVRTAAQGMPDGRVEVSGGVSRLGERTLGTVDATQTTSAGGTSTIFKTATTLERDFGWNVRLGARAWRNIEGEAFAIVGKPTLSTVVSNDIENATGVTATETITEYLVGGGALWYPSIDLATARFKPFVGGSVAYLRQLHEGNTLAVTGRVYELGVGAKYFLATRPGRLKGWGLRGDARVAARSKGVAFNGDLRYAPALSASLFARF